MIFTTLPKEVVDSMVLSYLESFDCPRSLSVYMLYKYNEHAQILKLPLDTHEESSYVVTKFLSKFRGLRTGIKTKEVASSTWFDAESRCAETNRKLEKTSNADAIISMVSRRIDNVLSRYDPLRFLDLCSFGPGADLSTSGTRTSTYNKVSTPGTVTREASIFLEFIWENSILSRFHQYDEDGVISKPTRATGNRVTFVPKNSKTDRAIAVEPRWNIFLQKGMGQLLRAPLRQLGIDLATQQTVNASLAREGSVTGKYATIDLASASDTIATNLVKRLFPPTWFEILDRLRSKYSVIDGVERRLEKFCSMGNGFAFELETFIFTMVVREFTSDYSVFGDDIVVPTEVADDVVGALELLGFKVNTEKTYISGPFRESCGKDYLNGKLVTPLYLKELSNYGQAITFANGISAVASRLCSGLFRDRRLHACWSGVVKNVPESIRHYGPCELSYSIHHDYAPSVYDKKHRSWCGSTYLTLAVKPRLFRFVRIGPALVHQLLSPSNEGYGVRDCYVVVTKRVFLATGYTLAPPWG